MSRLAIEIDGIITGVVSQMLVGIIWCLDFGLSCMLVPKGRNLVAQMQFGSTRKKCRLSMCRSCILLLLILVPNSGFAHEFHFGAKAGVPLMSSFEGFSVSSPIHPYTVGASAELRFGAHFGIEVDGLYKRIGYSATLICGLRCTPQIISMNPEVITQHISDSVDAAANSWEFPVMAKYSIPVSLHPFLAGGFSVRHVGLASGSFLSTDLRFGSGVPGGSITTATDQSSSRLPNRILPGIVASIGFEIRQRHFSVLPEFRYTGWFPKDTQWGLANFKSNQAEILVGILY